MPQRTDSVLNLAQRDAKTEGKDFANASDCLEAWDDSDSITAVNAQKGFETFTRICIVT